MEGSVFSSQIKIAAINVNSIVAHQRRLELSQFIAEHNHDILLLSETKLNGTHKISLQDYDIIRNDRPYAVKGGGTAIVIKRSIPYTVCNFPSSARNAILEYTIIKLPTRGNNNIFVVSVYARSDNRDLFIRELNSLFTSLNLHCLNNFYIIAGDFNARRKAWGDRIDNQRGVFMNRWETMHENRFKLRVIGPSTPTYKPAQTYLDICLADARLSLLNGVNGRACTLPYDSDHTAITLRFGLSNDGFDFTPCPPLRHRLNYKATKWEKFAKTIVDLDDITIPEDRNLAIPEIDEYVHKISSLISDSASIVVPKINTNNNNTLQYVNHKIRKLQKRKSQLVSLLHYLHIMDPGLKLPASRQAKELLKYTIKELRSEFRMAIENFWTRLVKKIDHRNPASFFPRINALFRPKHLEGVKDLHISRDNRGIIQRSRCDTSQPVILDNNIIFSDSQDKLNIIGAFYESINSPRPLNSDTRLKVIVDEAADKLKSELCTRREQFITTTQFSDNNKASNPASLDITPHPFCNIASVDYILRNLPNKTSSGLDNIPPILLKHLPVKTVRDLTVLLNNAINHNYFPTAWKKAKVFPILKKGKNPHDPSSYRPISLTPSLSKVYESVINNSITSFCSDNKIIPDHQFGFKNRHSTVHAVHKLLADLNTQVGNCKLVGAALLDLEKAFDSVWLNGLIYKLLRKNFPKWLVLTIWDMIRDKSFVTWDGINISSEEFMITEGLQQGTVNSPIRI